MESLSPSTSMRLSAEFRHAIEALIQIHAHEVALLLPAEDHTVSKVLAEPVQEPEESGRGSPRKSFSHIGSYHDRLKEAFKDNISAKLETSGQCIGKQVSQDLESSHEASHEDLDNECSPGGGKYTDSMNDLNMPHQTKSHIGGHGLSPKLCLLGDIKQSIWDGTELDEFEYDVSKFYHQTGFAQAIARSRVFGLCTMCIIILNAIYMGVESQHNVDEHPQLFFQIFDIFFGTYFLFEWCCRFLAFETKRNCVKDFWFKCDSFLVFTVTVDLCVLPLVTNASDKDSQTSSAGDLLQIMRLFRLGRMVRILHALPELATLVKAIFVAMRAVCVTLFLQLMFIYGWAIALHELLKDDEDMFDDWGTLGRCMLTLVTNGTLGDGIGETMRSLVHNVRAFVVFFAFVLFSTITLTNMLIGLLCEVVSEVANAEEEYSAISRIKSEILIVLKQLDIDKDGSITQQEFLKVLRDPRGQAVLEDLSIDVMLLVKLCDMLYDESDTGALSIQELMQLLLDSQGDRKPTYQDMVSLLGFTRWSLRKDLDIIRNELHSMLSQKILTIQNHSHLIGKNNALSL